MSKTPPPIPEDNQSHKGPGSAPSVPLDTTKGHRDDEKHNIREQGAHGNMEADRFDGGFVGDAVGRAGMAGDDFD